MKEQLDCGVRYCDLRIAHRPNDNSSDLYFYHGVYTTITVEVHQTELQLFCSVMHLFIASLTNPPPNWL